MRLDKQRCTGGQAAAAVITTAAHQAHVPEKVVDMLCSIQTLNV